MVTIQLGTIKNNTSNRVTVYQITHPGEIAGTALARLEPHEALTLNKKIDMWALEGHVGGLAPFIVRNAADENEELLISILWAEQDEGIGFFVDMTAQNRQSEAWLDLEGFRLDTIPTTTQGITVTCNLTIQGNAFEESSAHAELLVDAIS